MKCLIVSAVDVMSVVPWTLTLYRIAALGSAYVASLDILSVKKINMLLAEYHPCLTAVVARHLPTLHGSLIGCYVCVCVRVCVLVDPRSPRPSDGVCQGF